MEKNAFGAHIELAQYTTEMAKQVAEEMLTKGETITKFQFSERGGEAYVSLNSDLLVAPERLETASGQEFFVSLWKKED